MAVHHEVETVNSLKEVCKKAKLGLAMSVLRKTVKTPTEQQNFCHLSELLQRSAHKTGIPNSSFVKPELYSWFTQPKAEA